MGEVINPKAEEKAEKYGYQQIFALNTHNVLSQRIGDAIKARDSVHLTLCIGLLANRMAYDRAVNELRLEAEIEKLKGYVKNLQELVDDAREGIRI